MARGGGLRDDSDLKAPEPASPRGPPSLRAAVVLAVQVAAARFDQALGDVAQAAWPLLLARQTGLRFMRVSSRAMPLLRR